AIFGNAQPVWLEIGFGVGKFLLEMCRIFPYINFIGLENDGMRHKNMLDKLYKRGISNVRILYGDAALSVKHLFSDGSVEAVFINFPDPWPKDRHEKNRLFTVDFVRSLASILSPKGYVR
ncbi:hypothetical protein RZS08_25145, partial [Arthrospira platensis SPKY1]|nr:hypothetical protein [Arthrospira platensis SPKY1]